MNDLIYLSVCEVQLFYLLHDFPITHHELLLVIGLRTKIFAHAFFSRPKEILIGLRNLLPTFIGGQRFVTVLWLGKGVQECKFSVKYLMGGPISAIVDWSPSRMPTARNSDEQDIRFKNGCTRCRLIQHETAENGLNMCTNQLRLKSKEPDRI